MHFPLDWRHHYFFLIASSSTAHLLLKPFRPLLIAMLRTRRLITRPYLYAGFFLGLLMLLFWWNSLPSVMEGPTDDFQLDEDDEKQQQPKEEARKGVGKAPPIAKPMPPDEPEDGDALQKKGNIVHLTVYMEAQCPDTTGFIRRQLLPSWARLGGTNRIQVKVVPFGKASCTVEDDDYKCECQHGANECELNQLMNCAIEWLPEPDTHIPLIGCIQGKDNLISAFRICLNGHSSSDSLWKCTVGKQGRKLHAAAGNRTNALGDEFNFVPWVVLDGQRENDAFYALEENLCKRLQEPRPHQCAKFS